MKKKFVLVFDDIILKQLKKAASNQTIKQILTDMLDKIEQIGSDAGELLDSRLHLYEMKCMRPPIRLYFKHNVSTDEMYIFEYEMKTSPEKQKKTIFKLKKKILEP